MGNASGAFGILQDNMIMQWRTRIIPGNPQDACAKTFYESIRKAARAGHSRSLKNPSGIRTEFPWNHLGALREESIGEIFDFSCVLNREHFGEPWELMAVVGARWKSQDALRKSRSEFWGILQKPVRTKWEILAAVKSVGHPEWSMLGYSRELHGNPEAILV